MKKLNYGRHLPAFILLLLANESNYGSMLLNKMEESIPFFKADAPAVYRALNELENLGAVKSQWDTSAPGAAKKYYEIADEGYEMLKQFKVDIEERKKNFDFFLSEYAQMDLHGRMND
jgi:DNA-binding PadR family transcriptional regulator